MSSWPLLDQTVAALPDFVYTFDLEGRFIYSNVALSSLLQRTPDEMVGLNFHDLSYPTELANTLQAQIQEVIDTKGLVRAETHFEAASGAGEYEYIFAPILDDAGNVIAVAGTTRNITERRRMEDALRVSREELRSEREKLRNLFEQAPAFIATLSGPDFLFEFANEDYYRLIGRRDVLGKTVIEAFPEVVEQGYIDLLRTVYTTGEPFVGRSRSLVFAAAEGREDQHYIDFIYQATRNPAGQIDGILVHGVDVTEQVLAQREIERLNSELEERVKERTLQFQLVNQELEGFTYSVSHDLRAPLRAIVSSSKILLEDYCERLDDNARQELERQAAAANKLAVLIDELLKLSRLTRVEMRKAAIDVSGLVREIAGELSAHEGPCRHEFQIAENMVAVADPATLRLLLVNLLENACKFSPDCGLIEAGETITAGQPVYWIRDHGVGFDMRYVDKVFLPFERLVSDLDFPGSGIGLANAKRIVERHGGRIWAESSPGQGATFLFTLGG